MSDIERLTVTIPAELAAIVKTAVQEGDYASASEVIRESLRDWKLKRAVQQQEFALLKADIAQGLADRDAGRVSDFNLKDIVERGRKLLVQRLPSA